MHLYKINNDLKLNNKCQGSILFVQMSKMSSKISPIKCEPQNILTNIYIKQEYIDESVDRNDSYDCEFNFKWSVQDSKYITESVKTQVKTEVDIIDDFIYESFFKREEYNYDSSINMSPMSTTYDTKINPNMNASTLNLIPLKLKKVLCKKKQLLSQKKDKSYKPYKCGICNKSFSSKGNLKTHKIIHSSDKPFNCDICKKSFAQKVNMKTHMMFHIGNKSKKKTCNKTILLKQYLTKTLTVEDPYKSIDCNKLLSQGRTLNTPKIIQSTVIPFKCNFCSKLFSYKGNLKTHIRTHTGEKPYECNICKKTFTQSSNLKIHKINHKVH